MTPLTVTVITHNEGPHLAAALESVSWADEIVVIDSRSSDDTVEVARRFATRLEIRDWTGYGTQKNFAADLASHDWILSIDADERATPALAAEIQELMRRGPAGPGYRVSRVSHYLGRWIRSTDWFPDFHLRLYDRRAARWSERKVHESLEVIAGPSRKKHLPRLKGELLHHPYRDVSEHLQKIDRYTTLVAEEWHAEGRRANGLHAFFYPRLAFFRNYILRRGFRDGRAGVVVSMMNSYYVFLKYAKLIELQQGRGPAAAIDDPVGDVLPPR